jgi:hypothetical protein
MRDDVTTVDLEDPAEKIKAEEKRRQEEHAAGMADPSYRFVSIQVGELGMIFPMEENKQLAALVDLKAGGLVTFETLDKRIIIVHADKINCVTRMTYAHRFQDEQVMAQQRAMQQAQQMAAQRGQGPSQPFTLPNRR